jgi:2-phosphosulfolactate phosphatase
MLIHHADLETCAGATDTVVVIDVIRAFTTAAFALAAGARDIIPVSTIDEALALRESNPNSLVMGEEVRGLPPPTFDYGNSPSALIDVDLQGRRLIQRTGAGTQGLVRSLKADTLLATSFVCAGATIDYIKRRSPAQVTLVSTAPHGEDQACAAYLEARLRGKEPDTAALLKQAYDLGRGRLDQATWVTPALYAQFSADLDCCVALDRFDFAMVVRREAGRLIMEKVSGG